MKKVLYLVALEARSREGGRGYFEHTVRQIVQNRGGKIPTLGRIKWGKRICAWASIPFNFSLWMMPIGAAMQIRTSPKAWLKGRLNERNGNGDLRL